MSRRTGSHEVVLVVGNYFAQPLLLIVEPWANELEIAPGQKVRVIFTAPTIQPPEVDAGEIEGRNYIMVWGWGKSTFAIYDEDGTICLDHCDIPSP
jgi:hypothetical protein